MRTDKDSTVCLSVGSGAALSCRAASTARTRSLCSTSVSGEGPYRPDHYPQTDRADLLEAQASVDWSFSQFLSFNARLEKWLNASISFEIKNVPPPATHDVSFPFFSTKEAFRKQNGGPLLQKLPAEDRKIIETLKPYAEGNPILWSRHYLDIVRKHRRLLDVRIEPIHLSLTGSLKSDDFVPLSTGTIQVNDETVLGLLRKGVHHPKIQSRFSRCD